jgi:OOP family OmpA-OmpF porin
MRRLGISAALCLAVTTTWAAIPSVAVAQVTGPFMVFFDRSSTQLTPQGAAILDNAASAYRSNGAGDPDYAATVIIAGHTDSLVEGSAAVTVSQGRANNVRDYLVSRGIPAEMIITEAFGSTRPLVETGPGVSEPQNRRVEITFGPGSGW